MRIGAMAVFATLIVGLSLFSLVPASASEGFGFSLHIPVRHLFTTDRNSP